MSDIDLAAGVVGKCSVPLFGIGGPAGFCDQDAYGQQYRCELLPPRYQHPNRPPYAPGYCCKNHGGPGEDDVRFMLDGNMWMAFEPDFENLQESIAGFGPTQGEALADLIRNKAAPSPPSQES